MMDWPLLRQPYNGDIGGHDLIRRDVVRFEELNVLLKNGSWSWLGSKVDRFQVLVEICGRM